jgi:hypothetical protein
LSIVDGLLALSFSTESISNNSKNSSQEQQQQQEQQPRTTTTTAATAATTTTAAAATQLSHLSQSHYDVNLWFWLFADFLENTTTGRVSITQRWRNCAVMSTEYARSVFSPSVAARLTKMSRETRLFGLMSVCVRFENQRI